MRTLFRHCDHRFPYLWESGAQPPARWHGEGEGPCQYLASTPDGAWAEFLRHEEITDPVDLQGVARSLWAVEVADAVVASAHVVELAEAVGGVDSYPTCQAHARELRERGVSELLAPSAALTTGGARGQRTESELREADDRDGAVLVIFGTRPLLRGWRVVARGAPDERVLGLVRHHVER